MCDVFLECVSCFCFGGGAHTEHVCVCLSHALPLCPALVMQYPHITGALPPAAVLFTTDPCDWLFCHDCRGQRHSIQNAPACSGGGVCARSAMGCLNVHCSLPPILLCACARTHPHTQKQQEHWCFSGIGEHELPFCKPQKPTDCLLVDNGQCHGQGTLQLPLYPARVVEACEKLSSLAFIHVCLLMSAQCVLWLCWAY